MKVVITEEHIKNLAKINNYQINNLNQLKDFIVWKILDEAYENGASHLDLFIEKILHLAYEDNEGIERIEI